MQTHGGDHLHTGENSDGLGGSIGLCQNVMGGVHPVDHPLGGRHIQARLDGKEHWREAVGFIDIICGSGNVFGLFLKTWPRAENKANIVSIGGDAPTVQDSVDDIRGSGGRLTVVSADRAILGSVTPRTSSSFSESGSRKVMESTERFITRRPGPGFHCFGWGRCHSHT